MKVQQRITNSLNERVESNALRSLRTEANLVDFSSNDYLGLGREEVTLPKVRAGSSGSRLLTGNYKAVEELEIKMAEWCKMPSALFYNSGFMANVGLITSLTKRGDVVLYDQLIHASVRDGMRLSNASCYSFKHNDLQDLESQLLKFDREEVFVVAESVYSMDGDNADVERILELQRKYQFTFILDEAHSFGLLEKSWSDLFSENLSLGYFIIRVITFGKALGCDGAAILGSVDLRSYLINFSRNFIYTTGPSPHKVALVDNRFERMKGLIDRNQKAQESKHYFITNLSSNIECISGQLGNIVSVLIPGNIEVKKVSVELEKNGLDVRPIMSPTVPQGKERLRICFHEFNTKEEVDKLLSVLQK